MGPFVFDAVILHQKTCTEVLGPDIGATFEELIDVHHSCRSHGRVDRSYGGLHPAFQAGLALAPVLLTPEVKAKARDAVLAGAHGAGVVARRIVDSTQRR